MQTKHRWRLRLVAATLALSVIAAACGDDGGDGEASTTTAAGTGSTGAGATTAAPTTTAAPVKGGTLTIATFSNAAGLDPTKLAGGGTVGGMENAAIYDTIVSYDASTGKYTPRTGDFTGNADSTVWTLKLKSGIKFGDGTDYNAEAVKFVVTREMKEGNSSPRGQLLNFLDADPEKSMKVIDPLTLQFTLKLAWADFPYLFTNVAGWIYSPTQFQKVGAEKFNSDPGPAGAGPFRVKSYKPGEALELERNPNYWGGEVYLDGLIFKQLANPQAAFDAVKTGSAQAAYVRDPLVVSNAKKESTMKTVDMPTVAGSLININSGAPIDCKGGKPEPVCAGKPDGQQPSTSPLKDVNLRKAVQLAVDPKIVNERVWQGAATVTNAPFAGGPYDPKVSGPAPNVAEAKKLVDAAKAAGYNGKVRLAADTSVPAWGEAVRLQLVAAGFDVELQSKPISEIVTQVLTNKDYDLSTWAYGMTDEFPTNYVQLAGTFAAPNGRYGYSSPDMVAAIDKIRTAKTDAERTAAYKGVSEVWLRDMPAVVLAALPQSLVHTSKLQGVERTAGSNLLFSKAFLAK